MECPSIHFQRHPAEPINEFQNTGQTIRDPAEYLEEGKIQEKENHTIDNMDSFTHNIRDAIVKLGCEVIIVNGWSEHPDEDVAVWVSDVIGKHSPDGIVIGPGPSRPESYNRTTALANMGINGELISGKGQIPLLGICLGHQAICLADGSNLTRSQMVPSWVHS